MGPERKCIPNEIWHTYKYDMISDLQKRLFTSILQNSYFEKTLRVKIKTFKSLKEVMESFFNAKIFKSRKKVTQAFS